MKAEKNIRKILVGILSVLLAFSLMAFGAAAENADDLANVIDAVTVTATEGFYAERSTITSVTFKNSKADAPAAAFDFSAADDGSVVAWLEGTDLTIAADGFVKANSNSNNLFYGFTSLKSISGLEYFDTGAAESMSYMFYNCRQLESLDLSSFDTSEVTSMNYMFYNCRKLASLDLSSFDTSKVTGMSNMFKDCVALENLDLSGFDTVSVTDMSSMLENCNISGTLNISGLDTYFLTKADNMFAGCYADTVKAEGVKLVAAVISKMPTFRSGDFSSAVIINTTSLRSMFKDNTSLEDLILSNLKVAKYSVELASAAPTGTVVYPGYSSEIQIVEKQAFLTDISYMFAGCENLVSLNLEGLNTTEVKTMEHLFDGCKKFALASLPFKTEKLTDMDYMFAGCEAITELDLSGLSVNRVTDVTSLFSGCTSLEKLVISSWDMSRINSVSASGGVFEDCGELEEIVASGAVLSKTVIDSYFRSLPALRKLNLSGAVIPYCTSLFANWKTLEELDLSEVAPDDSIFDMSYMFAGCTNLRSLDLDGFDTKNISNMNYAFKDCVGLTVLDLSDFNTGLVKNMYGLFYGCSNLEKIYASDNWSLLSMPEPAIDEDGREIKLEDKVFYGCNALVQEGGKSFDANHTNHEYATNDIGKGYFTFKEASINITKFLVLEVGNTIDLKTQIESEYAALIKGYKNLNPVVAVVEDVKDGNNVVIGKVVRGINSGTAKIVAELNGEAGTIYFIINVIEVVEEEPEEEPVIRLNFFQQFIERIKAFLVRIFGIIGVNRG